VSCWLEELEEDDDEELEEEEDDDETRLEEPWIPRFVILRTFGICENKPCLCL
jgi:hypothetical protein